MLKFNALPQENNELAESLEQLRMLQQGMSIAVGVTADPPETGVDTEEDLARVNRYIAEHGL